MLKIKLSPVGKKHDRQYRIVVMEQRSKITGSTIAEVGFYNPKTSRLELDKKALSEWIKNGAQPTATVRQLISK